MKIKEINGLNVLLNKNLELMLALHAVYLDEHVELRDELDFVETPHIPYFEELKNIINSVKHQDIINDLLEFTDESQCVEIALSLNDNYEIMPDRVRNDQIHKFLGNVNLDEFVSRFKKYANDIKWDKFFNSHLNFYTELFKQFYSFPSNLDLNDIYNYYKVKDTSYNYIPSILMNGGFGVSDSLNNRYYLRGFIYDEENKNFDYSISYLTECLFHEFSHPIVNPLVDKYFKLFTNIDAIQEDALNNGLPKAYSSRASTLLYEYFVRVNASILNNKYYPESKFGNWILSHGFNYLPDLKKYTEDNRNKYDTYEEFFKNELIDYMNNILEVKEVKKR